MLGTDDFFLICLLFDRLFMFMVLLAHVNTQHQSTNNNRHLSPAKDIPVSNADLPSKDELISNIVFQCQARGLN